MAMIHGKVGALLINAKDCSAFTKSIDWEQTADDHDTTTFGNTGHTYAGGLTDGSVSLSGLYDNTTVTGPRAAVQASLGTVVAFKYRPEGVGTGKPESTCNVLVKSYKESVPVDDMVTWEAEVQISGAVTTTTQP
jgi:hypothetical protein